MIIELSAFSDKLRQYRLILQKLTSDQQNYQRRRERLSKLSQRRRSSRKPDAAECYMCNANVELESTDSFATCRGCERMVCRGENCSQWVESIGIWECTGCQSNRVIQQKAGEWLLNQLTARLKQPGPVELTDGNLLGLGLDSDDARSTVSSSTVSANQRIKVREFIEELLSGMLHGSLDDVSVGQLSKHESYIRLFRKFHTRLSRCLYNLELSIHHSLMADLPLWEGQQQHHSPSDQHFELKQLVQKILEEIGKLPELLNQSGLPLRPEEHLPYFDPRKYEQLLATAVLNKVVDDYRNPKNFANVGAGDVAGKSGELGSTFDINHNKLPEGAAGPRGLLNEESLRQMSVVADENHQHEAILNGATTDRRLSDTDESYLSDYIQRHKVPLPDLSDTTGSGSGAEDDDLQSLKSNATDGTWEENWLFRKRQLKTTESSIAMLVPSPTEEVKALIGDKNADEISDLSEAGSDCEGYESDGNVKAHDSSEGRQPPVVDPTSGSSKETSEGISSSSRANDSLDEQLAPDSLVSINSLPGNEAVLSEAKNDQLLEDQVTPVVTGGNGVVEPLLVDDLISIEPIAEKVETKNPTLTNPFLDDPFETNNNVITDDVKLLQRTDYRQSTSDTRSFLEPSSNGSNNRKEIPIDRASMLLLQSLTPPRSPVPQILSPHPIMMTITDVFDRMASSPLASICEELPPMAMLDDGEDSVGSPPEIDTPLGRIVEEERSFNPFQSIDDHESIQSVHTAKGDMWSRSNSFQVDQDNSEYRTVSEVTNNSLTMMDSFDEDESNLQIEDDEAPPEDAPSPHSAPSVAIYLRDQEEVEFSGQPDSLEDAKLTPTPDYDPFERDAGSSSRITMHPDLVTFENVPSPEGPSKIAIVTQQMRAYCEELKGILHPEDVIELDPEDPTEQWEIVEAPNEPADTAPQATASWDGSTPGETVDPTPIILKPVTEYSNIEHVQEAVPMEEQTQALPETRMDMETYPRALHVSSPEPSHHTVGIGSGATTEEPPAMTTSPSTADEPELMLASIESQSESKIEDTSMPFSDTELPSLSSPLLTTSSSAINTCMPTNFTDQTQACTSPNTDTNPSNGDCAENQVSQAPEAGKPTQTDSLLLGRNLEEATPKKDSSLLPETAPTAQDAGQQQKSPKGNYLSAVAREIFLLPLEPESEMRSLLSSSSEQSVTSPRQDFDSLTYSEDSDVTRIYDLTTGEAKVIRSGVVQALPRDPGPPEPEGSEEGDTILRILPQQQPAPSQTPDTDSQTAPRDPPPQEERTFLRPVQMVVKPLSPETIKFFAPKRKLSFTGSNNNLPASATESAPNAMHSSLHIEFPASRTPCGSEFSIIEKDVIDVLPSVKELAKCYSGSTSDVSSLPPKPLYKPRIKLRKDFLRQSSDMLSEETVTIDEMTGMPCTKGQRQYCSTSSIAVRDEIREIRKINLEAYRQSTYYPMAPGHSITARSLSKQIREHKTNVTDDHKVGQQEEVVEPTGNDGDNGHTSPERPSSPVLLPGHLKSSIEFFESLKNNQ
ncbi:uncharacterized protein LOC131216006 [Anopheles bellator]|uniref:uncharacterized protein LOC131216006 n=1 Tax=Anopheles bellator TaxID=139047 RepID=UPI002647E979|nr:uncharacterized protein LOC131216006 [Anopheles bellator]